MQHRNPKRRTPRPAPNGRYQLAPSLTNLLAGSLAGLIALAVLFCWWLISRILI